MRNIKKSQRAMRLVNGRGSKYEICRSERVRNVWHYVYIIIKLKKTYKFNIYNVSEVCTLRCIGSKVIEGLFRNTLILIFWLNEGSQFLKVHLLCVFVFRNFPFEHTGRIKRTKYKFLSGTFLILLQ